MTLKQYVPEIQEVISSGRNLNVLIVDDSKVVRGAIREILELGNITVTSAGDGIKALEAVNNDIPDLVLLDIAMPGIDGLAVLKKIRETYSKIQLPVILITTQEASNEIVCALDFGANDYVTKPIDFDVLWARLTNQLMQKQAAEYLLSAQSSLEDQIMQRTSELSSSNLQLKKEIEVRMLAESQLQKQANFDALTGLPNRSLATDRLEQTLVKAKRHRLEPCLAFLDLDNFKYINDTFGHTAGDELLKEVARRLTVCARESDTVARLGGDEFLLILDDGNQVETDKRELGIRHIAERIIESFSKPFLIEGNELSITPSLGFAIYPKDGNDSSTLMRHADEAMYRSKHDGKNTYCFYSSQMTVKAKRRMNIESQLQHALDRKEFFISYQPIVDSKTGEVAKAEVLLRWNSEKLGVVEPDCFIPIAEDTGLIIAIGSWVIRSACKQVKQWRDSGWGDICVSINVSERQLQFNSDLIVTLKNALNDNNLPANAIQLELSESVLMNKSNDITRTMQSLDLMGIKFSIDNFGSEYASISYLQRYNFDSIKIDRSYIENVEKDARLIKAIIAMAKSMGISIISGGVENKAQLNFLLNESCEYMQGYYFSKPVSPDKFVNLLKKMNRHAAGNSKSLVFI